MNDKSSIYVSIFNRKGGEGINTKIIKENNKKQYSYLFRELNENENPLIIYYENNLNWILLTNFRILTCKEENTFSIYLDDIVEVHLALQEEIKDGVMNKEEFTRLRIKTKSEEYFILKLEAGLAYQGLYQVLHFIVNNNCKTS